MEKLIVEYNKAQEKADKSMAKYREMDRRIKELIKGNWRISETKERDNGQVPGARV